MSQFEQFDPNQEQEFEDFDVMQEYEDASEAGATLAALGELGQSETQLNELLAARDELEQRLMPELAVQAMQADGSEIFGYNNIVGIGIGEQEVGGHPTGQLAVKVLVSEKVHASQVSADMLVPQSLDGVPTDVEATGEIYGQAFRARRRPAPGGVSIGNCNRVSAGTLGCLVTRNNQLFCLSNNHVMALSNASPLNTGISQPGRLDGGACSADIIARLTQFVPISFAAGANNLVDAAIARTSPNLVDRRTIRAGGALQRLRSPHVNPVLNSRVQKSGRTTQYRRGQIDLINTTVNVTFDGIGVARFIRQFRVRGVGSIFSDRGDSGSLVTTYPTNQPVGLLFAGSAASNTTFCNPISTVLTSFGVNIVY
jgi:hypothetical protein